ncbi:MAG TPA: 3-hydroxyacyl-CoA dehydrogenase, partial [Beijerinckiaceae bacterium]|nr:3-hydroxyacyl-CoA dehydrogenase [Beijerinckiaceae bacterium]
PFQTIELNAPRGIPDYCARYGDFFHRTTADPPKPAVWDEANIARVMQAWGRSPSKEEVARHTAWRDKRLTALMAHKRAQPDS